MDGGEMGWDADTQLYDTALELAALIPNLYDERTTDEEEDAT